MTTLSAAIYNLDPEVSKRFRDAAFALKGKMSLHPLRNLELYEVYGAHNLEHISEDNTYLRLAFGGYIGSDVKLSRDGVEKRLRQTLKRIGLGVSLQANNWTSYHPTRCFVRKKLVDGSHATMTFAPSGVK
jgi:hypothetical protein